MGIVQRIFYFHVASAWAAFLGFFIVAGASAVYLWKGSRARRPARRTRRPRSASSSARSC